jgi:3-hydroxymyristoyl/3-hydroxydecanoyl-(acyl carrier protein) dehydratase
VQLVLFRFVRLDSAAATVNAQGNRTLRFERAGSPHTFRTTLPADLVYFQGHFDELPLLPAVAQLSRIVLPLARTEFPDLGPVRGLRRIRFRRPIGPNRTITIALSRAGLRVSFEITLEGQVAASGALDFQSPLHGTERSPVLPPGTPTPGETD